MNFVRGSNSLSVNEPTVTWNNNPIYESPQHSGISWADQVDHWNPEAEGITSIPQHKTENPIPYWASRDTNLANVRQEYARIERQVQSNSIAPITQTETPREVGNLPTPVAPVQDITKQGLDASKSIQKAAGVATGIGSGALGIASMAGGPLGSIAMANAALGSGVSSLLSASTQNAINEDSVHNSLQNGTNAGTQSRIIRDMQNAQAGVEQSGSQFGGLFGPVGALIGQLLGHAASGSTAEGLYDKLQTGYTFGGRFNPQDSGSVNASTSADLSGSSNMQSSI